MPASPKTKSSTGIIWREDDVKICVVTTSRADFGLLRGLMKSIRADTALRLQVIASGMHLAQEFGRTWRDIEAEGIKIDRKIRLRLKGDSKLSQPEIDLSWA